MWGENRLIWCSKTSCEKMREIVVGKVEWGENLPQWMQLNWRTAGIECIGKRVGADGEGGVLLTLPPSIGEE